MLDFLLKFQTSSYQHGRQICKEGVTFLIPKKSNVLLALEMGQFMHKRLRSGMMILGNMGYTCYVMYLRIVFYFSK